MQIRDCCDVERVIEKVVREYYFPLYPNDKPIGEMTSTEQGIYKNNMAFGSMLLSEISDLDVKLALNDDKLRKYINNFLSARHGFKYDGILARELAQALCQRADEVIVRQK